MFYAHVEKTSNFLLRSRSLHSLLSCILYFKYMKHNTKPCRSKLEVYLQIKLFLCCLLCWDVRSCYLVTPPLRTEPAGCHAFCHGVLCPWIHESLKCFCEVLCRSDEESHEHRWRDNRADQNLSGVLAVRNTYVHGFELTSLRKGSVEGVEPWEKGLLRATDGKEISPGVSAKQAPDGSLSFKRYLGWLKTTAKKQKTHLFPALTTELLCQCYLCFGQSRARFLVPYE